MKEALERYQAFKAEEGLRHPYHDSPFLKLSDALVLADGYVEERKLVCQLARILGYPEEAGDDHHYLETVVAEVGRRIKFLEASIRALLSLEMWKWVSAGCDDSVTCAECRSDFKIAFDLVQEITDIDPELSKLCLGILDTCLDTMYDRFDDFFQTGHFALADGLILDYMKLPFNIDYALGVLTATLPAADKLPARALFQQYALACYRGDGKDRLFDGLIK